MKFALIGPCLLREIQVSIPMCGRLLCPDKAQLTFLTPYTTTGYRSIPIFPYHEEGISSRFPPTFPQ